MTTIDFSPGCMRFSRPVTQEASAPGRFARVLAAALGLLAASALTALAQPATPQPAPAQSAPATPDPGSSQPAPAQSSPAQSSPAQASPSRSSAELSPAPAASPESSAGNVVEVAPKSALALEGQSTWEESYSAITKAFQRLKGEAERAGLKPAGRPIVVFVFTDDSGFRFRAMAPLAEEPASRDLGSDFAIGKTPGGRAVKFEHRGPYDEIDSTYEAITAWLDDRSLLAEDFFVEEWVAEGTSAGDVEGAVDIYVFVKK